eukprot:1233257-Pleurochrysis_carterae.AAC.1
MDVFLGFGEHARAQPVDARSGNRAQRVDLRAAVAAAVAAASEMVETLDRLACTSHDACVKELGAMRASAGHEPHFAREGLRHHLAVGRVHVDDDRRGQFVDVHHGAQLSKLGNALRVEVRGSSVDPVAARLCPDTHLRSARARTLARTDARTHGEEGRKGGTASESESESETESKSESESVSKGEGRSGSRSRR